MLPAVYAQLLNLLSMALREQAFFATHPSCADALREAVRVGALLCNTLELQDVMPCHRCLLNQALFGTQNSETTLKQSYFYF